MLSIYVTGAVVFALTVFSSLGWQEMRERGVATFLAMAVAWPLALLVGLWVALDKGCS